MKFLIVLVVAGILAGGVWVYFHQDQAAKIADQAQSAATKAVADPGQATKDALSAADTLKLEAEKKLAEEKMTVYKAWIKACQDRTPPPKYAGYDGFSYDKQSDYVAAEKEQEQRYNDLSARLNKAYGK